MPGLTGFRGIRMFRLPRVCATNFEVSDVVPSGFFALFAGAEEALAASGPCHDRCVGWCAASEPSQRGGAIHIHAVLGSKLRN